MQNMISWNLVAQKYDIPEFGSPNLLNSAGVGQYLDALSVISSKCMVHVNVIFPRSIPGSHRKLRKQRIFFFFGGGGGGREGCPNTARSHIRAHTHVHILG